jgi:hypothetical protein
MCIIIHKPVGKVIPEDLIKRQWEINPDGAGFAVRIDEEKYPLYFKKGIMKLEELLEDEEFQEFNSEDYELVLHLRKSTGGGVRPELCHPFPVLSRNRLKGYSKALLFHNGTFGLKVPKKYREKLSDTAFISLFARRIGLVNFKLMLKCDILNRNNSRVLLWTDSGMIKKGKWHQYRGLQVSKPVYSYSYSSSYSRSYSYSWEAGTGNYNYDFFDESSSYNDDYYIPEDIYFDNAVRGEFEIEVSPEGHKVFRLIGGDGSTKLQILDRFENGWLLEDGSLWEAPDDIAGAVEKGDYVVF